MLCALGIVEWALEVEVVMRATPHIPRCACRWMPTSAEPAGHISFSPWKVASQGHTTAAFGLLGCLERYICSKLSLKPFLANSFTLRARCATRTACSCPSLLFKTCPLPISSPSRPAKGDDMASKAYVFDIDVQTTPLPASSHVVHTLRWLIQARCMLQSTSPSKGLCFADIWCKSSN